MRLFKSGRFFTDETTGIIAHLAHLLTQHGCQQVQTRLYALEYRAGTTEGQVFIADMAAAFQTLRPFLQKWGCCTQDYDTIYQQAIEEMRLPNFYATWNFLSAWGTVP